MDTIADFFSQKDRIAELERQNLALTIFASKCKMKYEKIAAASRLARESKSRSRDAEVFVLKFVRGDKSLSLKSISEKFFLGYSTITNMASRLRTSEGL